MTWREYLTMVGFDLSGIPQDALLTFSGSCSTSQTKNYTTDYWIDAYFMDGPQEVDLGGGLKIKASFSNFLMGTSWYDIGKCPHRLDIAMFHPA